MDLSANVSETTKKIFDDMKRIYLENYEWEKDENIIWYILEDMLEAFLEWTEEGEDMDDEEWEENSEDEESNDNE
jgi:hypothetical protein